VANVTWFFFFFKQYREDKPPTLVVDRAYPQVQNFCLNSRFADMHPMELAAVSEITAEELSEALLALDGSIDDCLVGMSDWFQHVLCEPPNYSADRLERCKAYYLEYIKPLIDGYPDFWLEVEKRTSWIRANLPELLPVACEILDEIDQYAARLTAENFCGPDTTRLLTTAAVASVLAKLCRKRGKLSEIGVDGWANIAVVVLQKFKDIAP
jgi:hypothetical protein